MIVVGYIAGGVKFIAGRASLCNESRLPLVSGFFNVCAQLLSRVVVQVIGNGDPKMEKITRMISVNAPVGKVFDYLNTPTNMPEIWPSMIAATDVTELPNGGHRYNWVYKMAGMQFEGLNVDTEVVINDRLVSKTEGGIESVITFETEEHGEGTQVTFTAEYTVPMPLLGKLAEKFIVKVNEKEAEIILANLKARMET